jgi:hypothetical protein
VKTETDEVKIDEVKTEVVTVKTESAEVKTEVAEVKTAVKTEVAEVKTAVKTEAAEVKADELKAYVIPEKVVVTETEEEELARIEKQIEDLKSSMATLQQMKRTKQQTAMDIIQKRLNSNKEASRLIHEEIRKLQTKEAALKDQSDALDVKIKEDEAELKKMSPSETATTSTTVSSIAPVTAIKSAPTINPTPYRMAAIKGTSVIQPEVTKKEKSQWIQTKPKKYNGARKNEKHIFPANLGHTAQKNCKSANCAICESKDGVTRVTTFFKFNDINSDTEHANRKSVKTYTDFPLCADCLNASKYVINTEEELAETYDRVSANDKDWWFDNKFEYNETNYTKLNYNGLVYNVHKVEKENGGYTHEYSKSTKVSSDQVSAEFN